MDADLYVYHHIRRNLNAVRGKLPYVFTNCRTGAGLPTVLTRILAIHYIPELTPRPPPIADAANPVPGATRPDMAFVLPANPISRLLDGDIHEISLTAGAGAKAHITTQSTTKIYAMPPAAPPSALPLAWLRMAI